MTTVYIIANQHQQLLGKSNQWLDSDDTNHCFRTPHYDIALNQLIESNAREIDMRLSLLECPLDTRGNPHVEHAQPARKRAVQFDDEPPAPDTDTDTDGDDDTAEPSPEVEPSHE